MREVVNVQIGTFSNHIGAHFWNLQDEYLATPVNERELSPSVLFRESHRPKTSRIPQYAPRLQVVDLTGAFGSLSLDAGAVLAQAPETVSPSVWAGPAETYRRERVPASAYVQHLLAQDAAAEECASAPTAMHGSASASGAWQADDAMDVDEPDFGLDAGVRYWTDYLKTRLHPRSCFALPGIHAGVAEFDNFEHGREAATLCLCDDLYDDLRFFVEECDSLGGVHIMANADDGFAGLTSSYLARMRDELGMSTSLFVVGSNPERDDGAAAPVYERALRRRDQRAAEARLVAECIEVSAQYVPVEAACGRRLDYVHPMPFNDYHLSAVVALALDVGYTPLRCSGARLSSAGMINLLRPAPFASVSSLFTKFPVVQALTSVHEQGYFYNRDSVTKMSMRTFSNSIAPQVGLGNGPLRICEVVSSRGLLNECGIHATVSNVVTLPVAYPRFFDHRISLEGRLRSPGSIKVGTESKCCEVAQVRCISGFATSGSEGSTLLSNLGTVMSETAETTSCQISTEKSTLEEVAETLIGLGADYATV